MEEATMAEYFEERIYVAKHTQDFIRLVTNQQQRQQQKKELVAEEEIDEFGELTIGHLDNLEDNSDTESELEEQISYLEDNSDTESELEEQNPYEGMEFYHTRDDEEKRQQAELEAIARKWEMYGMEDEPLPEPEPEPEPESLTIDVEQILEELWMLQREAGFGRGFEDLCS